MDVQDMSKEQLIDLADESGRNLENGKSQITSLEADQRKLVSLLLRLTKITGSLRNRLFELSMDNKALTESLEKRAPDVHALFSDLRSNAKDCPSLTDFPSIRELEESVEAILGPMH
jgi:hypothetical protein